jgi:hypothetical protein
MKENMQGLISKMKYVKSKLRLFPSQNTLDKSILEQIEEIISMSNEFIEQLIIALDGIGNPKNLFILKV